jgi:hypothetical protein
MVGMRWRHDACSHMWTAPMVCQQPMCTRTHHQGWPYIYVRGIKYPDRSPTLAGVAILAKYQQQEPSNKRKGGVEAAGTNTHPCTTPLYYTPVQRHTHPCHDTPCHAHPLSCTPPVMTPPVMTPPVMTPPVMTHPCHDTPCHAHPMVTHIECPHIHGRRQWCVALQGRRPRPGRSNPY